MYKKLHLFFLFATFFIVTYASSARDYADGMHYPPDMFNYDQINNGAAVFYFLGLLYMFFGIMQVHRLYLEPCLHLFRKTKTFDDDTMDSTVVPIATTAPESFISFFATFFGVTDVGISAFLGTNAFTACVERGVLILIAGAFGEIDWYTSLRDMITYAITLFAISMLLTNGSIDTSNTILMLLIFFVYWAFMQFNKTIEKYARQAVYLKNKFRVGPRLTDSQISEIHSLKRRVFESLPESYIETPYKLENGWVECTYQGNTGRERVRLVEGTKTNLSKFYTATNKILCGIAANRIKERLERNAAVDAKKNEEENRFAQEIEEEYKNAEMLAQQINASANNNSNLLAPVDQEPSERVNSKAEELQVRKKCDLENMKSLKLFQSDSEDLDEEFENIQRESVGWPKEPGFWVKVSRICLYPVNLLLYYTIPTPRVAQEKEPNYLPLVFTMCLVWMGIFAFFITWWLVTLSVAFNLPFLILPMFVLPAGLFLRDFPHWLEFRKKIQRLQNKAKAEEEEEKQSVEERKKSGGTLRQYYDKTTVRSEPKEIKERIPEFYSGPIFTFTMGTSLTWLVYTLIQGSIKLTSGAIYLQLLLLTGIVLCKIVMVIIANFTTPRWLFYSHMAIYAVYLGLVIFIELAF